MSRRNWKTELKENSERAARFMGRNEYKKIDVYSEVRKDVGGK